MAGISKSYSIGIDIPDNGDSPVVTIVERDEFYRDKVVNVFIGEEAIKMYEMLTKPSKLVVKSSKD